MDYTLAQPSGVEPIMYTDVKTKRGIVRVHHETMYVMYKWKGDKSWRWMERTQDFVAHRHRKIARAVRRAVQRSGKSSRMRLVN